jgi:N-acetylneuraminate synthase
MLRERYPQHSIGFSDHTLGIEIAIASVALGSILIEKHFTLDKTKIGMDNQMALEPHEMKALVDGCRNVYSALGTSERIVTQPEFDQRVKMRRSLVTVRDLPAGTVLTARDIDAKRPGTGIPPNELDKTVGKKLITDIHADEIISADMIKY